MSMRLSLPALVVSVGLIVAGCGDTGASTDDGASTAPKRNEPTVKIPEGPPPKELVVRDIVEGDGREVQDDDTILVDYVGVYYESRRKFENSWAKDVFKERYQMDSDELIDGWKQGLEGMRVGGRRELVIPSRLAFGNGVVVYVIDLREIK